MATLVATQPVYGLPNVTPMARLIQASTADPGNSSPHTLVLGQTPRVGSLLVAATGSIGSGPWTVSGGGVTAWTSVQYVKFGSGNPAATQLWVGPVGASPSASITFTNTDYYVVAAAEFSGPVGFLRAIWQGGAASGAFTVTDPTGPLTTLTVFSHSSRGSAVVQSPTGLLTAATLLSSAGLNKSILLGYRFGRIPLSAVTFTGANDNQAAILAALA